MAGRPLSKMSWKPFESKEEDCAAHIKPERTLEAPNFCLNKLVPVFRYTSAARNMAPDALNHPEFPVLQMFHLLFAVFGRKKQVSSTRHEQHLRLNTRQRLRQIPPLLFRPQKRDITRLPRLQLAKQIVRVGRKLPLGLQVRLEVTKTQRLPRLPAKPRLRQRPRRKHTAKGLGASAGIARRGNRRCSPAQPSDLPRTTGYAN
ncbi:hypothetical protein B0H14DRAFT_2840195 [Mycena olivaceomarginata]|nr:hypothetical protein B0H14DRAFT_2840195 [Mycena olivaceomarginata]